MEETCTDHEEYQCEFCDPQAASTGWGMVSMLKDFKEGDKWVL